MDSLICSLSCCIPFKGEVCLLYWNVTEDIWVGSERVCSAAEGNEWALVGNSAIVCFHHLPPQPNHLGRGKKTVLHSMLMISLKAWHPGSHCFSTYFSIAWRTGLLTVGNYHLKTCKSENLLDYRGYSFFSLPNDVLGIESTVSWFKRSL